jgi:hypothetical protein
MATKVKVSAGGVLIMESKPKKSRQGTGKHSSYGATSRNGKRKRYRGQGRG